METGHQPTTRPLSAPETVLDGRARRRLGRVMRVWLSATTLSAGGACLLMILLVVPWTARSWSRAELRVPGLVAFMLERQVALAAVIALLTVGGVAAVMLIRNRGLRLAAYAFTTLLLLAMAAAGVIAWWSMYVEALKQASEI